MKKMTQGTKEWLEWRRQGIGASDVPIIMGESSYKTIQELWEEKVSDDPVEDNGNFITELGHKFEPIAREDFQSLVNAEYGGCIMESEEYPFIRASLDGINYENKEVLEIKMVGKQVLEEVQETRVVPEKHYGQCQQQLMVTGFKSGVYYCYTLNKDRTGIDKKCCITFYRDDAYIAKMLPKLLWFWNCVETKTSPIQGDISIANQYIETKEEIEKLTKRLDELKTILVSMSDEPKYTIGRVRVSKSTRKGSINYKAIPELDDVDLKAYRAPDTSAVRIDII